MAYDYRRVRLADINPDDDRFLIRYQYPEVSLEMAEVLPVVLIQTSPYLIVSGFRRYQTLLQAGKAEMEALILPAGLSEKEIFERAVMLNRGMSLSELDKSLLIYRALHMFGFTTSELTTLVGSLFEGKTGEKLWRDYSDLWNLAEPVKKYAALHGFGIKFITSWFLLKKQEQQFIGDELLPLLHMSAADFRALPDLCREISGKQAIRIQDIFKREELRALLTDENLASRQKAERLLGRLWQLRNPIQAQLAQKRREFEQRLNFKLPIQFEVPDAYEQDHFFLRLRFHDRKSLERALEEIQSKLSVFDQVNRLTELDSVS